MTLSLTRAEFQAFEDYLARRRPRKYHRAALRPTLNCQPALKFDQAKLQRRLALQGCRPRGYQVYSSCAQSLMVSRATAGGVVVAAE